MNTESTPEQEVTTDSTSNAPEPQATEQVAPVSPDPASQAQDTKELSGAQSPEPSAESASSAESEGVGQDSAVPKRSIQIGSQRDVADAGATKPKAVEAAIENPVQLTEQEQEPEIVETVELQSTAGLGDDIDAEIESMMSEVSMDAVLGELPDEGSELAEGARVKATIARITGENVFFKLPAQFEGIAKLTSFKEPPKEGELVEVTIRDLNNEDGLYEVGIPGAAVDVSAWEDLTEGEIIEARVSGSNTGGLEVMVGSIRGFIPASQIDRVRVENFGEYVGKKLECVVMEVRPRKKLVLSRRAVLDRVYEAKRAEMLETLEPGAELEGTITKLMDFGAFVDLGGIEGLIHISKLSWDRVKHPKDVVEVGERVKVKLESVDKQTGKLSLSHRDTMDDPWDGIDQKYQPDEIVTGTVTRIAQFGAFVKLEPGVEGLVHISEVAHHRVVKVGNYCNPGDEISCKVLSVDPDTQKISLSIKATQAAPEKKDNKKAQEEEQVEARPLAVERTSDEPLKGGMERKTGGEQFGLKW